MAQEDEHDVDAPGAAGAGVAGGMDTGAAAGAGPGGPDGGWAAGGEEAEDEEATVERADEQEPGAGTSPGSFLTDPAEAGGDDQTPAVLPDGPAADAPRGDVDPAVRGRGMGDLTSTAPGDDEPHPAAVDREAGLGTDLQPGAADGGDPGR